MKTVFIDVPDMQSIHCQKTVASALRNSGKFQELTTTPGKVQVTIDEHANESEAMQIIRDLGYHPELQSGSSTAMTFKTNIHCSGCVSRVTPALDRVAGPGQWEVDINTPDKLLTVNSNETTAEEVRKAIRLSGFKIQ